MLGAIAVKPVGSGNGAPAVVEPPVPVQTGPIPDAAPPAGFDQAYTQLRGDNSIQFEMQPFQPPPPPEIRPSSIPQMNLGPVVEVLIWVLIAIVVAAIIYLIVTRLTGFRFRRRGKKEAEEAYEPAWQIGEQSARRLLADADALAAEGRYDEAARNLLFRSIEEIDKKRPDTLRPAFTSREIGRIPSLPPSPAEAFGRIVRAVERSLFGRQPLGADDWRDCRDAYERFAFERAWQG